MKGQKPTPHNKPLKVTIFDKEVEPPNIHAHPILPQFLDFLWIFFGQPFRGKTTVALSLILEYWYDFDYFYVISPTAKYDVKFKNFSPPKTKNPFGNKEIDTYKELTILDDIDDTEKLIKTIKGYKEIKKKIDGKERSPRILLWIDDMTGRTNFWKEHSPASKFSFNRRHYNCAIGMNIHDKNRLPAFLRRTADVVSYFGQQGKEIIKDIVYENTLNNYKDIEDLFIKASDDPHSFITFHKRKNQILLNLDTEVNFN